MSLISNLLRVKRYYGEKALLVSGVPESSKKVLAERISSGVCEIYGIIVLNKVIGRIFLYLDLQDKELADGKSVCYFSNLWVHPKLRGHKLGSKLINHVIKVAKNRGFKYLTLGVHMSNEKNVNIYRHLGFNEAPESESQDMIVKDKDGNLKSIKKQTIFIKEI